MCVYVIKEEDSTSTRQSRISFARTQSHRCVRSILIVVDCVFRLERYQIVRAQTHRDTQVWAGQPSSQQTQRIRIKTNDVRKTTPKITLKFKWFTNNKNKIDCVSNGYGLVNIACSHRSISTIFSSLHETHTNA